jgi:hypothetical protein
MLSILAARKPCSANSSRAAVSTLARLRCCVCALLSGAIVLLAWRLPWVPIHDIVSISDDRNI